MEVYQRKIEGYGDSHDPTNTAAQETNLPLLPLVNTVINNTNMRQQKQGNTPVRGYGSTLLTPIKLNSKVNKVSNDSRSISFAR